MHTSLRLFFAQVLHCKSSWFSILLLPKEPTNWNRKAPPPPHPVHPSSFVASNSQGLIEEKNTRYFPFSSPRWKAEENKNWSLDSVNHCLLHKVLMFVPQGPSRPPPPFPHSSRNLAAKSSPRLWNNAKMISYAPIKKTNPQKDLKDLGMQHTVPPAPPSPGHTSRPRFQSYNACNGEKRCRRSRMVPNLGLARPVHTGNWHSINLQKIELQLIKP